MINYSFITCPRCGSMAEQRTLVCAACNFSNPVAEEAPVEVPPSDAEKAAATASE